MLSTAGIAKKWRKAALALAAGAGLCVVAVSERGLRLHPGQWIPEPAISAFARCPRGWGSDTNEARKRAKRPRACRACAVQGSIAPPGAPVIGLPAGSLASNIPTDLSSPTTQPAGLPVGDMFPIATLRAVAGFPEQRLMLFL